ncbi:hypothetical protein KUV86_12255 [Halomonas sp. DP8Y7-3]|uniref:hypothetical protein n=1 Tax=Halomonas sp. DP8Y7-3 TaxID=2859079 RepID=UPI001C97D999|nr:hypothetical protein [Halomonas sp. DP8Y7-3]MBY5929882.1 hypothetical protein [Halomonas sp. DP8Y7-3]
MSHYVISLNGKSLAFTEGDIPAIKEALDNASTNHCSTQRFAQSGLVKVTRSFATVSSSLDQLGADSPIIQTDC